MAVSCVVCRALAVAVCQKKKTTSATFEQHLGRWIAGPALPAGDCTPESGAATRCELPCCPSPLRESF